MEIYKARSEKWKRDENFEEKIIEWTKKERTEAYKEDNMWTEEVKIIKRKLGIWVRKKDEMKNELMFKDDWLVGHRTRN